MQAAVFGFSAPRSIARGNNTVLPGMSLRPRKSSIVRCPRAAGQATEPATVDYSSSVSVFPAEACDVVGGDACLVLTCPEVRLSSEATSNSSKGIRNASEEIDREYLQYNEPKTVFPADACDELGGEFCEAEYQAGVYK